MGAAGGSEVRGELAQLRARGSAVFGFAYARDEPAFTADTFAGVGVTDFARTRLVGPLMSAETVRRPGRGRPRSPVRRLLRRALSGLNEPIEREWPDDDRIRFRSGPDAQCATRRSISGR